MRKIIVVIVVIIIAAAAVLLLKGSNSPTSSSANNSSNSQSSAQHNQPQSSSQPATTDKVTIQNIAFAPANITVKKGTSVTWTNQDAVEHTVTENDDQTGPSSPPLSQGQSYAFTFNQAGTFKYHCTIHSEMTGMVTVTNN